MVAHKTNYNSVLWLNKQNTLRLWLRVGDEGRVEWCMWTAECDNAIPNKTICSHIKTYIKYKWK